MILVKSLAAKASIEFGMLTGAPSVSRSIDENSHWDALPAMQHEASQQKAVAEVVEPYPFDSLPRDLRRASGQRSYREVDPHSSTNQDLEAVFASIAVRDLQRAEF